MEERTSEKAFMALGYWFSVTGVLFGVLRIFSPTLLGNYSL